MKKLLFILTILLAPILVSAQDTINVYPNPAKSNISVGVHSSAVAYSIYDLKGSKVLAGTVSGTDPLIEVGSLAKGIYILRVFGLEPITKTIYIIQ